MWVSHEIPFQFKRLEISEKHFRLFYFWENLYFRTFTKNGVNNKNSDSKIRSSLSNENLSTIKLASELTTERSEFRKIKGGLKQFFEVFRPVSRKWNFGKKCFEFPENLLCSPGVTLLLLEQHDIAVCLMRDFRKVVNKKNFTRAASSNN